MKIVVRWLVQVVLFLNEGEALECLQDQRHHDHKGGLSESLAKAHTLIFQEWEKTERAPVRISVQKPLRNVLVVIIAPLVLIMMKLLNVDLHHLTLLHRDPNYSTSSVKQNEVLRGTGGSIRRLSFMTSFR